MLNSAMITVITKAVQKAGRGILRDFGEVENLQISKKGAANFVTSADLRTEKILVDELGKARPKFGFLTEETGVIGNPNVTHRFVIDPIDGTTNFIHAIPYISIAVAVQERGKDGLWETVTGVVYDPIHDELFYAEKNQGAFMNNQRLRVSERNEDILLSTSSPRKWREGYQDSLNRFQKMIEHGAVIRCSGSAALDLAYVAAGRLDGCWYNRLNAWDFSGGALIVKEAQGRVSALDGGVLGQERSSILATNQRIYTTLQGLLGQ